MFSSGTSSSSKIAVCQVTSSSDKDANFGKCSGLIRQASGQGAKMVFLPECVDFVGERKDQAFELAEPLDGPLIAKYKQLATECKVWLSLGSLHVKDPSLSSKKIRNTHVVINSSGVVTSTYDKVHLFDVDIPTFRIKESDFALAGQTLSAPVVTPVGRVGLAICYDMRFPELASSLLRSGAQILTYPSAFTVATGYAHWEALLRARAIETQCYVIAAAQVGQHNPKRSSYGHSLVIDPWGAVVAQASDTTNSLTYADIDLGYLEKVRQGMPVNNHRRPEIYGQSEAVFDFSVIDSQDTYQFGQVKLKNTQLFYKTPLSMAFVNKMPVLKGHVVVAPIRASAVRLGDMTSEEMVDIMSVVGKAQVAVETEYNAKDSTISLQDGVLAGRSIDHLHIHVLPRREGDFKNDNDIYTELQNPNPTPKKKVRTDEEMAEEAARLRKYFE